MTSASILLRSLLVVSLVALAGGCVPKARYDRVLMENEDLRRDRSELTDAGFALTNEVLLQQMEINQLEREQEELLDEVERWAVAGAITMQLLKDGLHILLANEVLFSTGSTTLKPEGKQVIRELVTELAQVPYQIAVLGYTDNVPVGPHLAGRFPSNWELAAARASSVIRELEADGIPSGQLAAVSFGSTRPVASNDTPAGRAQNRRIELRLRPVTVR